MGMWNRVRSLWENEQALESTAEALQFSLGKMSQQYPGRDLNAWLAWALSTRPGWGTMEKQELLLLAAPCSITTEEQATALLALDVVSQEYPELERVVSEKRRELYLPVDVAIKNGSFLKRWKDTNPWTDENFPSVEQELKLSLLDGVSSKAAKKLRIKCPKCPTELRIPSFTGGKKIRCPKCKAQFSVDP